MSRFISNLKEALFGKSADTTPLDVTPSYEQLRSDLNIRTSGHEYYKSILTNKDPRLLNWIGSVDYSGFVREECLRNLVENFTPGDENRIILRLEDWVPKIQHIAAAWVERNMESLTGPDILAQHDLFLYLSRKEKLRDTHAMTVINSCIVRMVAECSREEFMKYDLKFRRYIYGIALLSNKRLRSWLAKEKEPFNRLCLLRVVDSSELSDEEHLWLAQDRSAMVRRQYLHGRLSSPRKPSPEELKQFALDENRSIRAIAQFYLSSLYSVDAYNDYKLRKDDCFYYIADYAKRDDIDSLMTGLLKRKNMRVRLICLSAICRADTGRIKNLKLKQLLAESNRFRRILIPYLPRLLTIDEIVALRDTLCRASSSGVLQYLNLVDKKSHWMFLGESLSFCVAGREGDCSEAVKGILYVKSALYEPLSEELRQLIPERVSKARAVADGRLSGLLDIIEFAIRTHG